MVCTLLLKQLSKLICYVLTVWIDIKSRWRHNWKSAQVVNSHLVCDPTIRQPGFDLPRQQWSLLNHFLVEQGHCSACRRKWRLTDTDLCPCGCRILSPDKTEWQLILATLYTLLMKTLLRGWPVMVHYMHTRRRRSRQRRSRQCVCVSICPTVLQEFVYGVRPYLVDMDKWWPSRSVYISLLIQFWIYVDLKSPVHFPYHYKIGLFTIVAH